ADALRRLSHVLIEPIREEITRASTLMVSPDKSLRRVPFAALTDASGRLLIEDHVVIIVPSAAVADLTKTENWSTQYNILVLGDPRLDARTFAFLPPLPGAHEEASRVAGLYGQSSRLLLGQEATTVALLQGFGHYTVVHLAAHVLANDEHP